MRELFLTGKVKILVEKNGVLVHKEGHCFKDNSFLLVEDEKDTKIFEGKEVVVIPFPFNGVTHYLLESEAEPMLSDPEDHRGTCKRIH